MCNFRTKNSVDYHENVLGGDVSQDETAGFSLDSFDDGIKMILEIEQGV